VHGDAAGRVVGLEGRRLPARRDIFHLPRQPRQELDHIPAASKYVRPPTLEQKAAAGIMGGLRSYRLSPCSRCL